jgi:chemotaxis protein MotB
MARKKEPEKEQNLDRWLLTYADLITLLLIFFVIMYAMSKVDAAKFNQVVEMLSKAFGGQKSVIDMSNMGLLPQNAVFGDTRTKQRKLYVKAIGQLQKEISSRSIRISEDERGIVVSLASDFYFGSGKADFGDSTEAVLKKISGLLNTTDGNIRIEGHTDDMPIIQGTTLAQRLPTNWELSSQRAVNVLKFFEKLGLKRTRLSAAAYADTRPIKPNDTYEGRAYNRRVEIVIIPEGAQQGP